MEYDVFVSYARVDRAWVGPLVAALRARGLDVFVDEAVIGDFASITGAIRDGLGRSKALLACYSAVYPTRRACQWELTAAYLAASRLGDPARRVLVVNPEPGAEHLHPGELRDALFRHAPPPDDTEALGGLAQAVARHVAGLTGTLGEVAPLVGPRWVPTQGAGSTRFVGRLAKMWEVHSALHPRVTAATVGRTGPGVAQVRGLGGVGKSLLAEEYALRFGAAYPGGVFWLRAAGSQAPGGLGAEEVEARRFDEFRRVAEGLGLDVTDRGVDQLGSLLAAAIAQGDQPCLWVVDDLPAGLSPDLVRGWFAPHPLAATLMTTRSRTYDALAVPVDLDVLGVDEAYELLTVRRPPRGEQERKAARGIATALGCHALAVDVAGAGLRNQAGLVSYAEFFARLGEPGADELELTAELADALPNGHEVSITRTLVRSLAQLSAPGSDVLGLAAVLAVAPVPARLVAAVLAQADDLDERTATWRAAQGLEQAAKLSLATKVDEDGAWSVHALVARTVRFTHSAARLAALRAAAIAVLTSELEAIKDARAHTVLADLMPHAREVAHHPTTVDEALLLCWVARYDYERGAFASAYTLYKQQLDACRRLFGDEHPETLGSMGNLAQALRSLGDLASARTLEERVFAGFRRALGATHPDTLNAMNNLAATLEMTGDLAGARRLHKQALNARQRLLIAEHPDTLTSTANLAMTLGKSGDLATARRLHEQVLNVRRRLLGAEHPDTLRSMNNLAEILRELGDLAGARALHEQVVAVSRRLLGAEHPETLNVISNLGVTLFGLGDVAGARRLHEQVLDARRRLLAADHPDTLLSMSNLAQMLVGLGDLAGARALQEQVVDVSGRVLGEEHPDTLSFMSNLGLTLYGLGDLVGARRLHEQALDVRRRRLGANHPDTLHSMNYLGLTLYGLGDLESARLLHEQVLDVRRRVLGAEHPDTLTSISNLAETLRALGDLANARRLHEQVVDVRWRVLGAEHPDTLRSMNNLATTLSGLGDATRARALQEQVVDVARRVLGNERRETLAFMGNLAETLRGLGDLTAAHALNEQVLDGCRRVLGEEHPHTLNFTSNLGVTLSELGDLTGARALCEHVLRVRQRVLGAEHPDTLLLMNNLAATLAEVGELAAARTLAQQAVDSCRRLLGKDHPRTRLTRENLDAIIRAQGEEPQPPRRRGLMRFRRWGTR